MTSVKNKVGLNLLLATGFGLGLAPVASGTFGTLLGLPIAFGMQFLGGPTFQWLGQEWNVQAIALVVALSIIAVPICSAAEKVFLKKDDGRIVADEYLTFGICILGLPMMDHLWLWPLAFVTNRIFDILKLPPARQLQSVKGGLGIVIDDVIAAIHALIINHLVLWIYLEKIA